MGENEKTVRETYSLPSRIVSRDRDGETACALTYTLLEDGNCKLLCVRNDGMQAWFVCDTRGNVTERIDREADGTISLHFERKYDENGNFTDERHFNSDGQISTRIAYRYDWAGIETERLYYKAEQLQVRLVYENNADGKLRRMVEYDGNDSIRQQVEWEYDERGRVTKRTEFDGTEHIEEVVFSAYGEGENGTRWEEYTSYGADGGIINRTLENYDANDRMTKITVYSADGSVLESQEYLYCTDGVQPAPLDPDGDGSVKTRFVYECYENGKIEKVTTYVSDGSFETAVSVCEAGVQEKWLRLTAQTVYDPDGKVIRQAEITDTCEVTLTEAQYETFRWFCSEILDV